MITDLNNNKAVQNSSVVNTIKRRVARQKFEVIKRHLTVFKIVTFDRVHD
jgi:hypothetical protein